MPVCKLVISIFASVMLAPEVSAIVPDSLAALTCASVRWQSTLQARTRPIQTTFEPRCLLILDMHPPLKKRIDKTNSDRNVDTPDDLGCQWWRNSRVETKVCSFFHPSDFRENQKASSYLLRIHGHWAVSALGWNFISLSALPARIMRRFTPNQKPILRVEETEKRS